MDFLRRHVVLLIVTVVLGTLGAVGYGWASPELYRATTRLFFTTGAVDVNDIYQGTLAGQQRVKTYEVLVSDPQLLANAAKRAGSSADPGQIASRLHIDVPPGTIIMDIGVDDPDPTEGAALANGISDELIALVGELERPLGGGPPPVTLTVVEKAAPSGTPASNLDPYVVGAGAVIGLVIGLLAAFLIDVVRERRIEREALNSPTQVTRRLKDPVTAVQVRRDVK